MDHEKVIKRYDKALTLLEEWLDIASVEGPNSVIIEKIDPTAIYHSPSDDKDRWVVVINKERKIDEPS